MIDDRELVVSLRGARLYESEALLANALHFGSDFAGTIAVLAGLVAAASGFPAGDSIAALFVSGLVVAAAVRLGSRNVHVLLDRTPEDEARIAAAGDHARVARRAPDGKGYAEREEERFADVVIGVAPGAAIGQGHAAADRVEPALHDALPRDRCRHVEPQGGDAALRERVLAAALTVSHVRELHNLTVLDVNGHIEVSLHLKLPGDLSLDRAHDIAEQVEAAILAQASEVRSVRTHLEPIGETAAGRGRSTSTPLRSRQRCRQRRAPNPASSGSSAPRRASSCFSHWRFRAPTSSPTRTVGRA